MSASPPSQPGTFRERFLEALIESATNYAIIALDLDGRVISWNEGARRILGWAEAEIRGKPAEVMFTPEDRKHGADKIEMRTALAEGRSADERWHQRKDGTRFWGSGEMMQLRGPNGEVEGFVKIVRDRTEKRRADEARLEALGLNTLILNSSRDCILVLDLEGRIEFVSPGGMESLEMAEPAPILGTPWTDLWAEEDRTTAALALATARGGQLGRFQGVCSTWRGTQKCWDMMVSPLQGPDGSVARLVTAGRDITDLKQAETRLARSEERLSLALRAAPMVGIWDGDLAAGVVYGDANIARMYGVNPEDAGQGQPLGYYAQFIHPEDAPAVRAAIERVYESGDEFAEEYRIVRPDGEMRWVLAQGRVVRNAAGKALRFNGASLDVTDRRMGEERQRLLMEELAHRVKNTLTVVQAIVSQTLRGSGATPEAREALSTRLLALSNAHDLLMQGQWREASLKALVEGSARVHAHGEAGRFRLQGADVMLGSRSALALALVLHELATNAVKYGALSVSQGQVVVSWETVEVEGELWLRFKWREVGGPTVVPPTRQGFGSRLIERSFGQTLGSTIRLDYAETGVTFTFEAPLAGLQQG
ncbi:MAG: PAS domain S-box protein [Proteobacteria bacterium]|nr:PAS domain S-box protein [Pseudomonadota bacterium]